MNSTLAQRLQRVIDAQENATRTLKTCVTETQQQMTIEFADKVQQMQFDLLSQGTATQQNLKALIHLVAKQSLAPSLPKHLGTLFAIRVLEFDSGSPSLVSGLLPKGDKPTMLPQFSLCTHASPWKMNACRDCRLTRGHCIKHRRCMACIRNLQAHEEHDEGVVLVLTNADQSLVSFRWLKNEQHADEHLTHVSKARPAHYLKAVRRVCKTWGVQQYDTSVRVAARLKLSNIALLRHILQLEWNADLSGVAYSPIFKKIVPATMYHLPDPQDLESAILWHQTPSVNNAVRVLLQVHELFETFTNAQLLKLRMQTHDYIQYKARHGSISSRPDNNAILWLRNRKKVSKEVTLAQKQAILCLANGVCPPPGLKAICWNGGQICNLKKRPMDDLLPFEASVHDPDRSKPSPSQVDRKKQRIIRLKGNLEAKFASLRHVRACRYDPRRRNFLMSCDKQYARTAEDIESRREAKAGLRRGEHKRAANRRRRRYSLNDVFDSDRQHDYELTRPVVWKCLADLSAQTRSNYRHMIPCKSARSLAPRVDGRQFTPAGDRVP